MVRRRGSSLWAESSARARATPIRLADGELREGRHVCALFSGVEETYSGLLPFIAEGLAQGQRAVHVVGPAARTPHLERLASVGLDVEGALGDGRLEVMTWDASYLRSGRFDPVGMLLFLRKTLAEGRSRGYPATRFIGFMEWALEPAPGVDEVVAYESELDMFLRGEVDPVICAYDLTRHSAAIVARLQASHPVTIIGGKLLSTAASATSARERILDAASRLFSSQGVGPTGVDALIDAAGVAKATFYRYFPSKNDLIVEWLGDRRTRWLDVVRRRAEEIADGPDSMVPAFFDAVAEWLEAVDRRGCPYLNTAVELTDPDHAARRVIVDYLAEVRTYLADVLKAASDRGSTDDLESERLAAQLQTMLAGAITLSVARRDPAPARDAREAAISLLASAGRG
jgi:AcrR family transcriptional regulator